MGKGNIPEARGWRIKVLVQLEESAEPQWRLLPPVDSLDSLGYTSARELASDYAKRGRRARVVDPEGRESEDVPAKRRRLKRRRLAM